MGSSGWVKVAGAAVSVYPNPSLIGQPNTTLRKLSTSGAIGADPVIIVLISPPNKFLMSLNTTLS